MKRIFIYIVVLYLSIQLMQGQDIVQLESGYFEILSEKDRTVSFIETCKERPSDTSNKHFVPGNVTIQGKDYKVTRVSPRWWYEMGHLPLLISSFTEVVLPPTVKEIGPWSFAVEFYDLGNINLENVEYIAQEAFLFANGMLCYDLRNVKKIGDMCFEACEALGRPIEMNGYDFVESLVMFGKDEIEIEGNNHSLFYHGFRDSLIIVTESPDPYSIKHSMHKRFLPDENGFYHYVEIYGSDDIRDRISENLYKNTTIYVPKGSLDSYLRASEVGQWPKGATYKEIEPFVWIGLRRHSIHFLQDGKSQWMVRLGHDSPEQLISKVVPIGGAEIDEIKWSVADPTVLSVDQSGVIVGIGYDDTDVTLTVKDKEGHTYSRSINIMVDYGSGAVNEPEFGSSDYKFYSIDGNLVGTEQESLTPGLYIKVGKNERSKILIR